MRAVPLAMKQEIYMIYGYATSNNPEIMVPYSRKLVGRLIAAVQIAQTHEYDDILNKCERWTNDAVAILSSLSGSQNPSPDGWGPAVVKCEAAIQALIPMIHDPEGRWAAVQAGMLKFPSKEAPKEVKM